MNLRTRLMLLVLVATMLPATLIGLRFIQERAENVEIAKQDLEAASNSLALRIATKIQGTVQLHYGLSRAEDLDTNDKVACSSFLSRVLKANTQYTGILTITPDGQLFCDSLSTGRTLDLRDRGYFRQALVTMNGVTLEPVFGKLTGIAVLQVAYPVRSDAGALRFVLLASLNLDQLVQQFMSENPHAKFEIALTDNAGKVLVGVPSERWKHRVGQSIAYTDLFRFSEAYPGGGVHDVAGLNGSQQVWAFAGVPEVVAAGLHVMVGTSRDNLLRNANQRFYQDLSLLLMFSLVLFGGIWWMADHGIRKPTLSIARMVKNLGSGDLSARIAPPFPLGEIGGLMTVLNSTASALEHQRADIVDLNTKLTAREAELNNQYIISESALNNMSQGLCMFDASKRLVTCNRRFVDLYQLPEKLTRPGTALTDILAHRVQTGSYRKDLESYFGERLDMVAQNRPQIDIVEQEDGRTIEIAFEPLPGGGWVATHEDITARRQAEARVIYLANHDSLTDLPNRTLFHGKLEMALGSIARGGSVALHSLDLDHFKDVNDTLGHPMGDILLQEVAKRLEASLREGDLVARLGGDEFAIIQMNIDRPEASSDLAQRLIQIIGAPYLIDGHNIVVGASIGVTIAPADGLDVDQLLKNADLALYRAKSQGRGTFSFFEQEMDIRLKARRQLEKELRGALEAGEFEVNYQPLFNIAAGRISGFEALLRWHHPIRGVVLPHEFIPLAEDTGLIVEIGDWVLRQACAEAAKWPATIKVAVNLSAVQFNRRGLLDSVLGALAASSLSPERLELEITETVLLQKGETTVAKLHKFRSLGIRIALDDFGTGYSSLSYLRSFPFDKIKIDRSFVKNLSSGRDASAIVRTVTRLAQDLDLSTTAEGVETQEDLDFLREIGCTEIQGYLISPAVTALAVQGLLMKFGGSITQLPKHVELGRGQKRSAKV
jgi:diguanylate cyclase (GGDEF)-like protein